MWPGGSKTVARSMYDHVGSSWHVESLADRVITAMHNQQVLPSLCQFEEISRRPASGHPLYLSNNAYADDPRQRHSVSTGAGTFQL